MEKVLTITAVEAHVILDIMDSLEAEFGGCIPIQGVCKDVYYAQSSRCQICRKLRRFLDQEGKEE